MTQCIAALLLSVLSLIILSPRAAAAPGGDDKADLAVVHRIRAEAFQNSKVMDTLLRLTDVNGPRLAGSAGYRRAAEWAVQRLKEWGIAGARLDPWGREIRGWTLERFSAHLREPAYEPLAGIARAWTDSTRGVVTGEVVLAPLFEDKEDREERHYPERLLARIERYENRHRGKLRGRMVLIDPEQEIESATQPATERYDHQELKKIARAPEPHFLAPLEWPIRLPRDKDERERLLDSVPIEVKMEYYLRLQRAWDRFNAFLRDEGVLAAFSLDTRGHGAIVFGEEGGSYEPGAPLPPPMVMLRPESYLRLLRLVEKGIPAKVELQVEAQFSDEAQPGVNVIAEISGGARKDEWVMLGGHLDSWHGGTGATDNASGCAVALEAMRILKSLGVRLDRSVRLGLWDGEEIGYFGSRGYVKATFADPVTMTLKPAHARLAGYFNVDNGSGRIRGVYLQGNDMVRPIFESWLAPFEDLGADTLTIADTHGTDHLVFNDVGLPGFQFIQDPLDYESRTHHSDLDVADHVEEADLMQASAVLASFVYHTANRTGMLPRKPLPRPLPPRRDTLPAAR